MTFWDWFIRPFAEIAAALAFIIGAFVPLVVFTVLVKLIQSAMAWFRRWRNR